MKMMKRVVQIIAAVLLIGVGWYFVGCHYDQWRASVNIDGVEQYAAEIGEIQINDEVRIIALGEATHGNREFQEMKLALLQTLVPNGSVKAFALEVDFGDGLLVNDYIQGKSDLTSEEAVKFLSFDIYQTKQMSELLEWLKAYNANVSDSDMLAFYGFDMQNPQNGVRYIIHYLDDRKDIVEFDAAAALQPLTAEYIRLSDEAATNAVAKLEEIRAAIAADHDSELVLHAIDNVLHGITYFKETDMSNYTEANNRRDQWMKENVDWILSHEEGKGNRQIMIAGHNGHIAKKDQFYTSMGQLLKEEYRDGYYAIGTDYFHTNCNITNGFSRANHRFNSADPLAYQAKTMPDGTYFLDFGGIDKDSDLYDLIHSEMYNGDLGENYSIIMTLLPKTTRKKVVPCDWYDSMIYVYRATPLELM